MGKSGWNSTRSAAIVYLIDNFFSSGNGRFWEEMDVLALREPVSDITQLSMPESTLERIRAFAAEHGVSTSHAIRVILYDRLAQAGQWGREDAR